MTVTAASSDGLNMDTIEDARTLIRSRFTSSPTLRWVRLELAQPLRGCPNGRVETLPGSGCARAGGNGLPIHRRLPVALLEELGPLDAHVRDGTIKPVR